MCFIKINQVSFHPILVVGNSLSHGLSLSSYVKKDSSFMVHIIINQLPVGFVKLEYIVLPVCLARKRNICTFLKCLSILQSLNVSQLELAKMKREVFIFI